ncbi:MAG: c-type cytochrome biogenesis protein CcmI [Roseibium sp.]|nr:c-type cytochrome biogenesis protein CcmI [Roseibium sp.]
MLLWILIAAMTAAASLAILVPLSRRRTADQQTPTPAADEAVYRQQLDEIDRDLERGLIDRTAADAARTEIARRLLAANERREAEAPRHQSTVSLRTGQALAILALPAFALGLYIFLGSPNLPDQPLSARLEAPTENQTVEELVARVERHLADNPEDGQGWAVIAPVYMSLGNPQASARAYANVIRLLGPTVERVTDMGEAMTMANDGIVSASARSAFERAVGMDPTAVKPRFFLALALGQEGKTDEAIAAWETLLEGADPREPWVPVARAELERLGGTPPTLAETLRGPSREDMDAAAQMSAEDRQAMIAGMVEGLAARLQSEGGSPAEWQRLVRAYAVMGEPDKAHAALRQARDAFGTDQAALGQINATARELGLTVP